MKPSAYLDAVKAQLNIQSDYELEKRLGVGKGHVNEMRSSKRAIPLVVAFKIAIALQLDPAHVVADLEEQRDKNEERRAFWRGFLSRAAALAAVLTCTLVLSFSATFGAGAVGPFGSNNRRRLSA